MKGNPPTLPLRWLAWTSLVAAVAAAQTPLDRAQADPSQANRHQEPNPSLAAKTRPQTLLEQAIFTLESRHSITARITYHADLFGKRLFGSGVYFEQRSARIPLLRLELTTQLGQNASTLVKVCDGRFLWMYRKLLGNGTLSRIDVAQVTKAMDQAGEMEKSEKLLQWPGLGGLPRLLRALDNSFRFTAMEQTQLKTKRGLMPAWMLRGRWKANRLARLLPDQKEAIQQGMPADMSKLPRHLPEEVLILLGQEDLFPYRIEYRGNRRKSRSKQTPAGGKAILTMQFYEVSLNVPVDPARFVYNPGDLKASDDTKRYLESLGLKE